MAKQPTMIQVKNLHYRYPVAKHPVLNDLNFNIKAGEIFGFLGPSGAGKSTTQKLLYKILQGFSGQILIEGSPINQLSQSYFNKIGVGFELPNHYLKLTARENLALFSSFYPNDVLINPNRLFAMVGLQNHSDQAVETFSKGMQMRLNFIRAIMHDPEILFFDEPTAGLDPINTRIIKEHILQLREAGKTIFITTHDMSVADQLCDRVAFLIDGTIATTDTPDELKRAYGQDLVQVELLNGQSQTFPLTTLGTNTDFLAYLKQGVKRINTLEATLEEVFIKVTGQELMA